MPLYLLKLEDRILFDAAAPAVIAQVAADAGGEPSNDTSNNTTNDPSTHTDGAASDQAPDGPALVDAAPAASSVNVLVVSSNVDNAQQLADAAHEGIIVVRYDYNTTTFDQLQQMIRDSLNGRQADTIAFATEGQSGLFHLVKGVNVTADSLIENAQLADFWKSVGSMMNDGGRVDLLGCFIAGAEGNDFGLLNTLENLIETTNIDIDIAASTDLTGNIRDGNWILEVGNVDASSYFNMGALAQWSHTLATFDVTNTNDSGAGSLREAIIAANAAIGADTITFSLDVSTPQTIILSSNLPTLTDDVTIDGTSATNYIFGSQMVTVSRTGGTTLTVGAGVSAEIRGLQITGSGGNGIALSTGSSTIRDNIISGNSVGINITGGTHTITGNYIGTDVTGMIGQGNSSTGITITGGTNHIIGVAGAGNVISSNNLGGIGISGTATATIQGNIIGLNADGDAVLGGSGSGISLSTSGSVTIGGNRDIGEGNTISGNGAHAGIAAIGISAGTHTIYGNYIGTDVDGTLDLGNAGTGIVISGGTNHIIGGGGTGQLNVISGNGRRAIDVTGSATATIQGNIIGLNADGDAALANAEGAILLTTTGSVTIGGNREAGEGNTISGNGNNAGRIAIEISGANAGTHTFYGNYIGTDVDGTLGLGNLGNAISISGGTNHIIGGTGTGQRNVISGQLRVGLIINGSATAIIQGNYIGLGADGETVISNGIGIELRGTSSVTVGGTAAAERNVISGNGEGFRISAGTHTIYGNYIGTDAGGTLDKGNTTGINISGGTNHVIGGIGNGQRNVISGNNTSGINISGTATAIIKGNYIGTDFTGQFAVNAPAASNLNGITISSTATSTIGSDADDILNGTTVEARNIISGNRSGVRLSAGTHNVYGNYIGTDVNGAYAVGNTLEGIVITGGSDHQIGGALLNQFNVISGNGNGINISGSATATIRSNIIGLAADGETALGNSNHGINLTTTGSVTVGGNRDAGEGNTISGNGTTTSHHGINITAGTHTIYGNYIGTDVGGTLDVGNTGNGIAVSGGTNHIIGGAGTGQRNVISGNNNHGIAFSGGNGTVVRNNYIGTNAAGTAALGNTNRGIDISSGNNIVIGGSGANEGNVISGNAKGIEVRGGTGLIVQGNIIGRNAANTAEIVVVGGQEGIDFNGAGFRGAQVGGVNAGEGNVIASNVGVGVRVNNATGVAIRGNSIFSNGGIGIDLVGTGNNNQQPPVINDVAYDSGSDQTTITITFEGIVGNTYAFDFFANPLSGDSPYEGETYLGTLVYTLVSTTEVLSYTLAGAFPATFMTSTATNTTINSPGNTSEFSYNDAPTSANSSVTINEDTPYSFQVADFPFDDVDAGDTISAIIIESLPANGTLLYDGDPVTEGMVIDIDNIGLLVFISDLNESGVGYTSFEFRVRDTGDIEGTLDSAIYTMTINVTAVYDAPVITVPGTQTVGEDSSDNAIFGISISDGDEGINGNEGTYTVNLSVANGVINIDATGLTLSTFTGSGTDAIQLVGSFADINAALETLTYTPDADFNGSDTLNIAVNDDSNTGSNPSTDDVTTSVAITVTAAYDAPVISVPGAQTVGEDSIDNAISGISISDVDEGVNSNEGTYTVNLSVANGVINIDATGLTLSTFIGSGTDAIQLVGSFADINAALATLNYTPDADFNGADTLNITVNDDSNTGSNPSTDDVTTSVAITVTAAYDAPVISVPGAQTVGEDSIDNAISGISISDVDEGVNSNEGTYTVNLSVANGVINIDATGLTLSTFTGSGTDAIQLVGSFADINAALATLTYTPDADFNGSDTLNIAVNDDSNTGSNPSTDDVTAFVAITVTAVNDTPTSADNTVTTNEDVPYTFQSADFAFNDIDVTDTISAIVIESLPVNGRLIYDGEAVDVGMVIDINNISLLVFEPALNENGNDYASFEFRVRDDSGEGATQDSAVYNMTIDVDAVDDAPVLHNQGLIVDEGKSATIDVNMLELTDVDTPSDQLIYTITDNVDYGTLRLNGVELVVGSTFTQQDINNGLLTYTHRVGEATLDGFQFTATDGTTVINADFAIEVVENSLLAEPDDLFNERFKLGNETSFSDFSDGLLARYSGMAQGFFNLQGRNQLTSFGDGAGFLNLARMGDNSLSFTLVNGEPTLSHRNRGTGYGSVVSAIEHAIEHAGFRTNSSLIQNAIEELTAKDTQDLAFSSKLNKDLKDIAHNVDDNLTR